ncbi:MAG: phytanoyl-CoA dioxygenase family protein [Planctomycetota bacterium]
MTHPVDRSEALAAHHLERFRADGHVRLPGVFTPAELAAFEPTLTALVDARNQRRDKPWAAQTTYERAFVQITNLWRDAARARQFVFGRRLARLAAELLEVESVRLYHDQALYKEPSIGPGGHTPWHADQYYWPLASDRAITAWVPLVDVPLEMGPLCFAPGSQHFPAGRELAISDESEARCAEALRDAGFGHRVEPYALGDVSFHLGWTFHNAPPNQTATTRKVMTVIYIDAAMRVAAPRHAAQEKDLEVWFPGLGPGDLAASELNPVLWP